MSSSKKRAHAQDPDEPNKRRMPTTLPFNSATSSARSLRSSKVASNQISAAASIPRIAASYKTSIQTMLQSTLPNTSSDSNNSNLKNNTNAVQKNSSFEHNSLESLSDSGLKSLIQLFSSKDCSWTVKRSNSFAWNPTFSDLSNLAYPDHLQQSLFYYTYPSQASLPKTSSISLHAPNGKGDTLITPQQSSDSDNTWCTALENAANMVLYSPNRLVHVLTKEFTLSIVSNEHSKTIACINSTSLTFRRKMSSCGINFNLPLLKQAEEDADLKTTQSPGICHDASIDGTFESFALVDGIEEVKLLISFFIESHQGNAAWLGQSPIIVSFFPFVNGTLQRLSLRTGIAMMVKDGKTEAVQTVTIQGIVLPEAFQNIVDSFRKSLDSESDIINLSCTSVKHTEGCSIIPECFADTARSTDASTNLPIGHYIASAKISSSEILYTCIVRS